MRPHGSFPAAPRVSGGNLFLIVNYLLGFGLGQLATGSIIGGLVIAALAPIVSLIAMALFTGRDEVRRA